MPNLERGPRQPKGAKPWIPTPTGEWVEKLTRTQARKFVAQSLRRATDLVKKSNKDPDRNRLFISFRKRVREDLVCLLMLGLDPDIVMFPMLIQFWLLPDYPKMMRDKDGEVRMFKSSKYWEKAARSLQSAYGYLSNLTKTGHYQSCHRQGLIPPRGTSLARFFYHADRTVLHIGQMLSMIEELRLDERGWTGPLVREAKRPPAPKEGRRRSGAPHQYDWAECALGLSEYFEECLGGPHWRTIARFLHFVACADFPVEILPSAYTVKTPQQVLDDDAKFGDAYVSRIQKRVEALRCELNRG